LPPVPRARAEWAIDRCGPQQWMFRLPHRALANLQATYGPANVSVLDASRADLYTWHDQTHNNQIKLIHRQFDPKVVAFEDMCDLNYQPLQDSEDEVIAR
jgi:hypothetical protein